MIITGKKATSLAATAALLSLLTACEPPPTPVLTEIPKGNPIPPNSTCFTVENGFDGVMNIQYQDNSANMTQHVKNLNDDGTPYTLWCYPYTGTPDPNVVGSDYWNVNTLPPTATQRCIWIISTGEDTCSYFEPPAGT